MGGLDNEPPIFGARLTRERPADAVLVPRGFHGPGRAVDQHRRAVAAFGGLCGCSAFWWQQTGAGMLGLPKTGPGTTSVDADTLNRSLMVEQGNPCSGQERYKWYWLRRPDPLAPLALGERASGAFDGPGTPKAGFLRSDLPSYADPVVIASASEDQARRAARLAMLLRTAVSDPELYEVLKLKVGASDAEMEELFGHYDRIIV